LHARGDVVNGASLRDPEAGARACDGSAVMVNLAGETVAQRWSKETKARIAASRIEAPRALIACLGRLTRKPARYISASAIGYYGTSETATFTEESPPGNDFLATVCTGWEREAHVAEGLGMRVSIVRTGMVLGPGGGALAKLLPMFKAGGGGVVASGRQWHSWIHIDDLIRIYLRCIDGSDGVYNGVSPQPLRNREFTEALARSVGRAAIIPVPEFGIKLLLGEGAGIVTQGQCVVPERALNEGFHFEFAEISRAFDNIVRGAAPATSGGI